MIFVIKIKKLNLLKIHQHQLTCLLMVSMLHLFVYITMSNVYLHAPAAAGRFTPYLT